ncbi:hypothetical protein [Nocardioides sp. Kera G14]|uniref:hypothetical protein n=1 Tax=Nocardioides sp. Kera G14 TaxID=2884264 RepID=UPI001D12FBEF|nr:hypothetical protein [Nocardioides sp. Kera G14]UDY22552.1 hypothetical protein LH076_10735 [Nocardioides sp. Kera G14]
MTASTLARTAWEDMSTPAEYTADCRAAEAHLTVPTPRTPVPPVAPEHRFEELSGLARTVSYDLE